MVVLWRLTGEYGPGSFGGDYGAKILNWVEKNYVARPWQSERTFPASKTRLYLLRGIS